MNDPNNIGDKRCQHCHENIENHRGGWTAPCPTTAYTCKSCCASSDSACIDCIPAPTPTDAAGTPRKPHTQTSTPPTVLASQRPTHTDTGTASNPHRHHAAGDTLAVPVSTTTTRKEA